MQPRRGPPRRADRLRRLLSVPGVRPSPRWIAFFVALLALNRRERQAKAAADEAEADLTVRQRIRVAASRLTVDEWEDAIRGATPAAKRALLEFAFGRPGAQPPRSTSA